MKKTLIIAAFAAVALVKPSSAEVEELRAVTSLPAGAVFSQRFAAFVEEVNEKGKGIVEITIVGGPEAIPGNQQDTALRNGVVDIQSGPSSYYVGTVPESAALKGASVTAEDARRSGAIDMLDEAWQRKLNAKLLAWIGSGSQFFIFLNKEPELNDDDSVDFTGMALRSAPTYRDWFDALGAKNVMMPASDIFTAMQRGVVSGFGSPALITALGLTDVVKVRVGPGVWNNDVVIMMNKDRWDDLSEEAKKVFQDVSALFEKSNEDFYAAQLDEEDRANMEAGIAFYSIPGQAGDDYVKTAHETIWSGLHAVEPDFADKIQPMVFPEN